MLKEIKKDKSPGPDGLINNFYKDWKDILTQPLLTVLNYWFKQAKIPEDFNNCTIIMLKKNGNSTNPLDYRPISLLNTDYKLLNKLLAN